LRRRRLAADDADNAAHSLDALRSSLPQA
jgi:hypothetical protein